MYVIIDNLQLITPTSYFYKLEEDRKVRLHKKAKKVVPLPHAFTSVQTTAYM